MKHVNMDFKEAKKIYMIGIKGVGMTAVAQVLKLRGKDVVGSDTHEKFFTDEILKKEKIKFYEGFDAGHLEIEKPDLIIYSTAYTDDNVELRATRDSDLPILSYPEALGLILKEGFGIAVCGTHGKTTTTAMLGFVLAELGADPTVLVGSAVPQFGGNAKVGRGKYVVIEADEYQNKFLHFEPQAVILTSAEYDHPDFFKTEADYLQAFKNFIAKIPASAEATAGRPADGFLVACFDDKNVKEAVENVRCKIISYGLNDGRWRARNISQKSNGVEFEVTENGEPRGVFNIQLFGNHNVANALAVIAVVSELGYGLSTTVIRRGTASSGTKLREAIKKFQGTVRRFEIKGEVAGVTIIDDYGHHPTEIQVTLKAARQRYPNRRIWCVFHPHTFTRTKALLNNFAKSFHDADKTIVIDIYGSAREKVGGVHSRDLVELIKKEGSDAVYISTTSGAADYLADHVQSGDVVITMGAGDVWKVGESLILKIKNKE